MRQRKCRRRRLEACRRLELQLRGGAATERIPQRPLKDLGEDELRLSREDFDLFMSEFA